MPGIVPGALHTVIDWIITQRIFISLSLEGVPLPHPLMVGLVT